MGTRCENRFAQQDTACQTFESEAGDVSECDAGQSRLCEYNAGARSADEPSQARLRRSSCATEKVTAYFQYVHTTARWALSQCARVLSCIGFFAHKTLQALVVW